MLNFKFDLPTQIFFGKDQLKNLVKAIQKEVVEPRILLAYGQGSIKKSGLYDQIINIFQQADFFYTELNGIEPNPKIESVREGATICQKHKINFILAVGGGSVLDCAKVISAATFYKADPWDFFCQKATITQALPLGVITTMAATSSETNNNAVLSNAHQKDKRSVHSPLIRPKFAICDPVYTYSVSKYQTASGAVDMMSHLFEQYFSSTYDSYLQDRMTESLLKTVIHFAPIALKEPQNYEARANLLYVNNLALNGLLSYGKIGDWACHQIEHAISAYNDMTHGVGLAIITPIWMKYVLTDQNCARFITLAKNVWEIEQGSLTDQEYALAGIAQTAAFFQKLGMPSSLSEVGLSKELLPKIASTSVLYGEIGNFYKLNQDDVLQILTTAF
ncbi:iron-containing alcohol dehydrogenase [bacterium]|jgi:butanol dehydrogenase|nr:iron-containing alcohol dehydrogenase [bacterium]MBT3581799.1 iron-containing alcohol dehydrogenase [bacterium]MBT4552489.1 iron-containing alcohol dehydrogenase [bacterium]MBT7088134.1 iron-containing alcohol dehydrogenase [bacterium]